MEHGKHEPLAGRGLAGVGLAAVSGLRPGDYNTGGLKDVNYLAIPRVPEWLPDVVRPLPVAVPPVEPKVPEPTERPQPSTRGALHVYVTHYSAPIGAVVASEHAAGWRPGICATYPHRDESGRIIRAYLPGYGSVEFGTVIDVGESGNCTIWDTGAGFADGRPWLDIAVASNRTAKELGAEWRQVRVIE